MANQYPTAEQIAQTYPGQWNRAMTAASTLPGGASSTPTVSAEQAAIWQHEHDEAALDREFQQSSADKANAFNAEQAQINRDFQTNANQLAMDFSARQAALDREFQEKQRSTAYQVAMEDMRRAGLNPILAANLGGAGTTSGATASGISSSGSSASGVRASGSKADTASTNTALQVRQQQISSATSVMTALIAAAALIYTRSPAVAGVAASALSARGYYQGR